MNKTLKRAIEKFNNAHYFECHDILEDYWYECGKGEKDFYQGLLHYAVAFHHLIDKNNPEGAKLQFKKCIKRLKNYGEIHNGIDITKILKTSNEYLTQLNEGKTGKNDMPRIYGINDR